MQDLTFSLLLGLFSYVLLFRIFLILRFKKNKVQISSNNLSDVADGLLWVGFIAIGGIIMLLLLGGLYDLIGLFFVTPIIVAMLFARLVRSEDVGRINYDAFFQVISIKWQTKNTIRYIDKIAVVMVTLCFIVLLIAEFINK